MRIRPLSRATVCILATALGACDDRRPAAPSEANDGLPVTATESPAPGATPPKAATPSPHRSIPQVVGSPTAQPSSADLGPKDTLQRLRDYRFNGRYSLIEPHLLHGQRSDVIAMIRAVDRLHAVTKMLRRRVADRLGMAAAQEFDYRQVANILGVFSPDVTLLTERIEGNRAEVSFQVSDRIPIDTAKMVCKDDRWLLVADPIEGVPQELLKLAFLLEHIADELTTNQWTVQDLRSEISLRQAPILRRLDQLVTRPTPPGRPETPGSEP